ncbi:MAG TPA: trypsin-like peptidase domain-containing protein [Candidatus Elarobacter sp.]|jgi:serine protease Do|nr:trypsin-like peptidase domain-containing protein [Candidatus Elarobacter sp.]
MDASVVSGPAVERDLEALAERLRASTVAVRVGRAGAGSGVIWASDGAIVTNAHVASRPRAEVVLSDGRRFDARLERRDAARDLALLRIDARDLPAAAVREPGDLRPGEVLVAVGHPLGIPNALTMGIAHAAVGEGARRFVQADLRLAPGNSGGPLADARGRVVGINSMVAGGLALAVPSDDVQRFTGALREPSLLGVQLAPARLRDGRDVLVVIALEAGGRAQRAGLLVGDVLLARDPRRLRFASALDVLRGGAAITVPVPPDTERVRAA